MDQRYPAAVWRPTGRAVPSSTGAPRVLVFHTMVGALRPRDEALRAAGWATFGIGGPWDGPTLDGAVWQWQALAEQGDPQVGGETVATRVETSDGGDPLRPWSARQLAAAIALGTWWCRQTGHPAQLVRGPHDAGIGYHAQFAAWNPEGSTCPGRTRVAQLLDVVIPGIARAVRQPAAAAAPSDAPALSPALSPAPALTSAPGGDVPLSQDDLNKIAAVVWGATFGGGPTTGALLQRGVVDVDAIARAVVAALPPVTAGLTPQDVEQAVRAALGGHVPSPTVASTDTPTPPG